MPRSVQRSEDFNSVDLALDPPDLFSPTPKSAGLLLSSPTSPPGHIPEVVLESVSQTSRVGWPSGPPFSPSTLVSPGRQKQELLQSEFRDSQGHTEKSGLKTKQNKNNLK